MNSKVLEEINKLKNDYIHGASWLSLHAINTLILAVSESQAGTVADFVQEIKEVAEEADKCQTQHYSYSQLC